MKKVGRMSKEPKEFEISKLLELTDKAKYAVTVAAFETVDKLDQLDLPRKYSGKKASVRAMMALSEGIVTYDFIDENRREALEEELRTTRKGRFALDAMFSTAPMADDSDEELDEDIMTEPSEEYIEPPLDEDDDSEEDEESGNSGSSRSDDEEDESSDDFEETDSPFDEDEEDDTTFEDDEDED